MRRAREFRETAWNVLRGKYWWAVLAALIAVFLGGYAGQSTISLGIDPDHVQRIKTFFSGVNAEAAGMIFNALKGVFAAIAGFAFTYGLALFIIGSAIELGYDLFNISLYQSAERSRIETIFSRFSIFGNALLLRFLMFLKVLLWTLLFIVPGIIAAFRYALAPYLMAEHPELSATEAIEQSKQLMLGHKSRLFWLKLSFFGWYLLAALTGGIGWIFLAPYVKAAETAFYLERTGRLPQPVTQVPVNAGSTPGASSAEPQEPADREWI